MARLAFGIALLLTTATAHAAQAQEQQPEIGTPVACEKDAGCTEDPELLSGLHDAADAAGVSEEDLLGALNSLADAGVQTDPATYVCFDDGVLCPAPPPPVQLPRATVQSADPPPSIWDRVAQCESGGNWHANTGNGFSGGLQFTPSTWRAYGGVGSAANASRAQQIAVAQRVLAGQGARAWPVCGPRAGLR